jgi:hypothetical protein
VSESVDNEGGTEMSALEVRLIAVETLQKQNLPKFNNLLRRMTKVEKAVGLQTIAVAEIVKLQKTDAEIRAANAQKLDDILNLLSHAKSVAGFARKHGPRVLAFLIGGLVLSGRITPEWAQKFLHLFGL